MIKVYLFDWGDTLMVDFPDASGKMCDWQNVEAVSGAKETLEALSKHCKIYIATGGGSNPISLLKGYAAKIVTLLGSPYMPLCKMLMTS